MNAAGMIVDSFAGGGGASTGIFMALGRHPDVAINHDADALAMHAANHPTTLHIPENVWQVDPDDVCRGREIDVLWASPDCKHFSKAKGAVPVDQNIRGLAWVVVRWASRRPPELRPKVIFLENVEEFGDWGPVVLMPDGRHAPCPDRKGEEFERWCAALRKLGYKRIESRESRACDYGAPTIRKRLMVIARRDGRPIVWPEPTHGAPDDPDVIAGRKLPWRTAASIIDWSIPCPSIFMSREDSRAYYAATGIKVNRPLKDGTNRRIARGVMKYVIQNPRPFIVGVGGRMGQTMERSVDAPMQTLTAKADSALVVPYLVPRYGEAPGQEPRCRSVEEPFATIVPTGNGDMLAAPYLVPVTHSGDARVYSAAEPVRTFTCAHRGEQALVVAAFMAQHNFECVGREMTEPLSTLTTRSTQQNLVAVHMLGLKGSDGRPRGADEPLATLCAGGGHASLIYAFLTKYYGPSVGQQMSEPLHTLTSKARFGVVTVKVAGQPYVIVDIGMRMLTPREMFNAQGFPQDYIIDRRADGTTINKTAQTRMVGNSVSPPWAEAHVRANVPEMAMERVAA